MGNYNFPEDRALPGIVQKLQDRIARLERSANLTPGVWVAYTPTLGGFTIGNGTVTGRMKRIGGKTVHFRALATFGSTSAATASFPTLTLPVAALDLNAADLEAMFTDVSASAYYTATTRLSTTGIAAMGIQGASGLQTACSTTTPFTWATGDTLLLSGTYEAA